MDGTVTAGRRPTRPTPSPERAARLRAISDAGDAICRKYNLDDLGQATAAMLLEQDELIRSAGYMP